MNSDLVTIVKDGILINIEGDNLHKGDVVVVQVGELVPADLKLIEVRDLEVDEFELNGEILPVLKDVSNDNDIIYMGSKIVKGTGRGVVIAIGEQTEYGKILKQERVEIKPYKFRIFKKQYLVLAGLLLPAFVIFIIHSKFDITLVAIYLLLSIALLLLQNDELFKYRLTSNELKKIKRFGIQVRDARIVESLNKIDTICFDKTGVLTTRQMDIKKLLFIDSVLNADKVPSDIEEGTIHLTKLACALCHDVNYLEKLTMANPIDKALISFAQKNDVDVGHLLLQSKRIFDKPFDSENRYMACGYEIDGKEYYFAKGDPSEILNMCHRYLTTTGTENVVDVNFLLLNHANTRVITQNGDTAIALAYSCGRSDHTPQDYIFLCLLQLENSLQPNARDTIQQISALGIRSLLLTGDKAETAIKIGIESGITSDSRAALTGNVIERMGWFEVARQAAYCSVFARLSPSQKGILVIRLQQAGHTIAMIGDGSNDGIALRVSDVGISFIKNSSPIARRLSKILINDLADLLRLIEGAKRINGRARNTKLARIIVLVVSLLGIYGWLLFLFIYRS
jgi:Ca2+-transporting ATPase